MKKTLTYSLISMLAGILLIAISCTKLDVPVYDRVSQFWKTDAQIAAGIAPVYAGLRNGGPGWPFGPNIYNLNELSTDEIILPTRGTDWDDNGMWQKMWKHTWDASSEPVLFGWQFIFGSTGIPRVNNIIQSVEALNPRPAQYKSIIAELRTIRAYYHFIGLDLFGNIPIVDSNYTVLSKFGTRSRSEVFAFVEKELKESMADLSGEVSPRTYGRATKWFAWSLLAKLYLNAEVYTGNSKWQECIAACDSVLLPGNFTLEPDFFANFKIANESSRENIIVLPFDRNAGLDVFLLQLMTLHYFSNLTFGLQSGGANGYCSTAEYLAYFSTNDERLRMFLVGQQYENNIRDSAHMQYTRSGYPLSFDPSLPTFKLQDPIIETGGARCAKWEFNREGGGNMSNDFAIFRLADIILMKAEAQYRKNDLNGALTSINQKINAISIRSRARMPDFTASELTNDGLLAERARELSWEGWRRNDMIRLGHFLDERNPEKTRSAEFRKLFPIPQSELMKNPNLKQNPGY
jgi:hypothetical protein